MIIKFDKPPWRSSRGGGAYIKTTGVEITAHTLPRDYDATRVGDCVLLCPITSAGESSETCRLGIAMSAIPELIGVLYGIWAHHQS